MAIDADALWMETIHRMDYCDDILEIIESMPTIEPERKTGKWIKITTGAMREKYMCSICGRTIEEDGIEGLTSIRYPFCHCGAKMEDTP